MEFSKLVLIYVRTGRVGNRVVLVNPKPTLKKSREEKRREKINLERRRIIDWGKVAVQIGKYSLARVNEL